MSESPPVQFTEYPRTAPVDPEAAAKLQALSDAYFKLSYLFLAHVVAFLLAIALGAAAGTIAYFVALAVIAIGVFWFGLQLTKKVGYGLNWSSGGPILAAFSLVVFGIIGYAIVQTLAAAGMTRLGVRKRAFGARKKDIKARIAELQGNQ